jgi:hypothetical protein
MHNNKNLKQIVVVTVFILIIVFALVYIVNRNNIDGMDIGVSDAIFDDSVNESGNFTFEIPTKYELCMDNYDEIAAECEAFKNNDPSICDNIINEDVKLWCKAKVSGDNSYCDTISPDFEDAEDCYIDTAKTVDDCNNIDMYHQDYEKSECLAVVTKDASLCSGPEYDRIVCVADVTDDASLCDQSDSFLERWDCKIGLQYDEPGICEQYHKEFCMEFYPPEN